MSADDTTGFAGFDLEVMRAAGELARRTGRTDAGGMVTQPPPPGSPTSPTSSGAPNKLAPSADALFTVSDDGTKVPLVVLRVPESNAVGGYCG